MLEALLVTPIAALGPPQAGALDLLGRQRVPVQERVEPQRPLRWPHARLPGSRTLLVLRSYSSFTLNAGARLWVTRMRVLTYRSELGDSAKGTPMRCRAR